MTPVQAVALLVLFVLLWKWLLRIGLLVVVVPLLLIGKLLVAIGLMKVGALIAIKGMELGLWIDHLLTDPADT